ncbi:hypothetical protein FA95DRAFT_607289 [Auriscalpium vulgare]|uniref:Uncharacterized protein n=1 Tax=Auriscalpium vulgare TaxID=40419 RepID=A0ACB8RED6_9AGAM|nr:hypothetical protein FA95DRAFT_607289 [Auriscalpium vulgare]
MSTAGRSLAGIYLCLVCSLSSTKKRARFAAGALRGSSRTSSTPLVDTTRDDGARAAAQVQRPSKDERQVARSRFSSSARSSARAALTTQGTYWRFRTTVSDSNGRSDVCKCWDGGRGR